MLVCSTGILIISFYCSRLFTFLKTTTTLLLGGEEFLFILLSSFWALKDMQEFRNVKLWILRILTVTCLYTAAMLWLGVKNGKWYLNFLGSIPTTCKVRMQDLVVRHWYIDPCMFGVYFFIYGTHEWLLMPLYYRILPASFFDLILNQWSISILPEKNVWFSDIFRRYRNETLD